MGSHRKSGFLVRANAIASSSVAKIFFLPFDVLRFTTNLTRGWLASLLGISIFFVVGAPVIAGKRVGCISEFPFIARAR
jgi:hypothetical protein